jgi:hypothetical protein
MIPDPIKENLGDEVAKKAVANIALFTSPTPGKNLAPHVQHGTVSCQELR